jgi:hypothetical protein
MSLIAILLLNGQLTFGLDLSQSYNTAVFTGHISEDPCPGVSQPPPTYCPEPAPVNNVKPSASARMLYDRSGYYLEYEGDYTFYDFDPLSSELAHNGDLRGRWELGTSTVFEATELVGYGSSNTVRQLDVMAEGSLGLAASRSRFLLNIGRLAMNTTLGSTTDLAVVGVYSFRRTLDNPDSDIPMFNFDGFEPRFQIGLERSLDDDNAIGVRLEYAHSFRPLEPAGPMFDGDALYEASAVLTYRHKFSAELAANLEAGGVVAGPASTANGEARCEALPEEDRSDCVAAAPTGTYFGPAAGAALVYTGSYIQARLRYTYGFGGNGVAAASAAFHEVSAEAELQPNPLRPRLTFYGAAEGHLATEVLSDLATQHRTIEASAGARYYLAPWLRLYLAYSWRYQTITDTPNGELDRTFKRHIATIGLAADYAMPRHMNAGQDLDETESSEWWGDVDSAEETERRLQSEENRRRQLGEEDEDEEGGIERP